MGRQDGARDKCGRVQTQTQTNSLGHEGRKVSHPTLNPKPRTLLDSDLADLSVFSQQHVAAGAVEERGNCLSTLLTLKHKHAVEFDEQRYFVILPSILIFLLTLIASLSQLSLDFSPLLLDPFPAHRVPPSIPQL